MTNYERTTANYTFRTLFMVIDNNPTDAENVKISVEEKRQRDLLKQAELNCTLEYEKSMNLNGNLTRQNWCNLTWDGLSCWPATPPNTIQTIPCPKYLINFNYEANATKSCLASGNWYVDSRNNVWSNYTECLKDSGYKYYLAEHLTNYYLITAVGYTVSLIALLAAFFIFTFNKRLRSPKNNLHIKLFLSFILRCVLFHIKRLSAFSDDFSNLNNLNASTNSTDLNLGNNMPNKPLACKIFTIIWQFSLLANYNFILMEAVYLHSLISLNTFNDNSSITRYVVFGWGFPVAIIIPWSLSKYYYENNECWTTIDNTYIFWIIKGPITITIILSFAIFVNVIRIIYLKIFSSGPSNQINKKYTKMFRSTLVLVPLFGVHFTILLVFKLITFNHKEIEIILFYFDLIFTSFQGFFVALLYCFLSTEVILELRKSWRRFRIRKQNTSLKTSKTVSNTFNSVLTQSIKQNNDKKIIDNKLNTNGNSYIINNDNLNNNNDDLINELNKQTNDDNKLENLDLNKSSSIDN